MIEARGLARIFKTHKGLVEAVRGVDLSVRAGEIVGFLGPNGAGKTTTLRLLTTLLTPTAGSATVAGCDLLRDPAGVRQRIGYVAQGGGTDPTCPAGEELIFQAEMYRISGAEARRRAKELFAQLELAGLEDRPVKTCPAVSAAGSCGARLGSSAAARLSRRADHGIGSPEREAISGTTSEVFAGISIRRFFSRLTISTRRMRFATGF